MAEEEKVPKPVTVRRDDRVRAELVSPVMFHNPPKLEVVGKYVFVRDLHGKEFWKLKFQHFYKVEGDVIYYMYLPLPDGKEAAVALIEELARQNNLEVQMRDLDGR